MCYLLFDRSPVRFVLTALLLILTVGCAGVRTDKSGNPFSSLLHSDYFQKVYEDDPDNQQVQTAEAYTLWIERFYYGWIFYETGWIEISEQVLSKIENPFQRSMAEEKLSLVGKIVVAGWAKHSGQGMISTSTLSNLGDSLKEASSRNETVSFLDQVYADVLLLYSGDLQQSDIQIERYFPDLATTDDWNSFF